MAAVAGHRRVESIMGTAIVVEIRGPDPGSALVERAFDHLRAVDARFSTYRPDSEISRLGRGDLRLDDCGADVREVLRLCEQAREASDGFFDVRHAGPGGVLDPSGLVKGWAVEGAAKILDEAGVASFCINAGGDVFARGEAAPGMPWRIGIRNPWDALAVACVVSARDLAVATSGSYERGDHVIVPSTGRPPAGIASMTVVGPSITWADTWATAAFAMGVRGVDWVARELDGYDACAISSDGHLVMSTGFRGLRAEP